MIDLQSENISKSSMLSHPGSFRDPSGHVFHLGAQVMRQVNESYRDNYESLLSSGLYEALVGKELLVQHEEIESWGDLPQPAYKILKPEQVPFISYPYEWSFSQLKDAALATLEILNVALDHDMTLKDSNACNIQFVNGKPKLIDTLSFESYVEGRPWVAYKQFCQHFLAPLCLMAYCDVRLVGLLQTSVDGIPLDLVCKTLPKSTWLNPSILVHIFFHARCQKIHANDAKKGHAKSLNFSKAAMKGMVSVLQSLTNSLTLKERNSEWLNYYAQDCNYATKAMSEKEAVVERFLEHVAPKQLWDLGANAGKFSRLASAKEINTISMDVDPLCVERNYLNCKKEGQKRILPLVMNLILPSPGVGWLNEERLSLSDRGKADAILALALIHHLAIGNNVPFIYIARFFSKVCRWLIIEFVPKSDSQVQRLLLNREDIFVNYTQEQFEAQFGAYFRIKERVRLPGSERTIYLLEALVE